MERVTDMEFDEWRERYKNRNDISSRLTHLTKGTTSEEAFQTLLKILEIKKSQEVQQKQAL